MSKTSKRNRRGAAVTAAQVNMSVNNPSATEAYAEVDVLEPETAEVDVEATELEPETAEVNNNPEDASPLPSATPATANEHTALSPLELANRYAKTNPDKARRYVQAANRAISAQERALLRYQAAQARQDKIIAALAKKQERAERRGTNTKETTPDKSPFNNAVAVFAGHPEYTLDQVLQGMTDKGFDVKDAKVLGNTKSAINFLKNHVFTAQRAAGLIK
jgi:hypothetical protein